MERTKTVQIDISKYNEIVRLKKKKDTDISKACEHCASWISTLKSNAKKNGQGYFYVSEKERFMITNAIGCNRGMIIYHETVANKLVAKDISEPKPVVEPAKEEPKKSEGIDIHMTMSNSETNELLKVLIQKMDIFIEKMDELAEKQNATNTQVCRLRAMLENNKGGLQDYGNQKAKDIIVSMCGTKYWAEESNILAEADRQQVSVNDMREMLYAMGGERQTRGFGDKSYKVWLLPKPVTA